jgi:hypothetical protein
MATTTPKENPMSDSMTEAITEAKTRLAVAVAVRMLRNPTLISAQGAILANLLEAIVPAPTYAGGSDVIAMMDVRARYVAEVAATLTDDPADNTKRIKAATQSWKDATMLAVRTAHSLGERDT